METEGRTYDIYDAFEVTGWIGNHRRAIVLVYRRVSARGYKLAASWTGLNKNHAGMELGGELLSESAGGVYTRVHKFDQVQASMAKAYLATRRSIRLVAPSKRIHMRILGAAEPIPITKVTFRKDDKRFTILFKPQQRTPAEPETDLSSEDEGGGNGRVSMV